MNLPSKLLNAIILGVLWAGGVWFGIEMIRRIPADVRKMREAEEWTERAAIVFLWCAAVAVLWVCGWYAVEVGERIAEGLKRFW